MTDITKSVFDNRRKNKSKEIRDWILLGVWLLFSFSFLAVAYWRPDLLVLWWLP